MSKKIAINPGWDRYNRLTFAPAVRKGNMLFITGMDGAQIDPATGNPVVKGDMAAQTEICYQKIGAVLKAAGATFEDVVWTTDYITTTEGYRETGEVRRKYFGTSFPASTGIIVKGLLNKDARIEIDAVAILG